MFIVSHPPFPYYCGADEPPPLRLPSQSAAAGTFILRCSSQENFSMPSAAALVITFGSLPMSDDQTNAMSAFDHTLSDFLTQTGLFDISAIEPGHGFLLFLHNVMGIVDVQTFVYSYTHFASAVGGTRPPPERFLDFFEMHGTEFKIVDAISGENVPRAKDRIVARIMRSRASSSSSQSPLAAPSAASTRSARGRTRREAARGPS